MPVIKRQAPLPPEGEYAGIAIRVSMDWVPSKPNPDGSKNPDVCRFIIPLHTHDGKVVTAFVRATDSTSFVFDQMCKSGNMTQPDTGEFQLTVDDLERRVFYFGVVHHTLPDGRKTPNVKFHTRTYALQVNPALATVTFPNAAPPITLRPAPSSAPPAPPEAESGKGAKVTPPPTAPAPGQAQAMPMHDPELEGMTEEEFQEALAYAKKLRKEKGEPPKAQAA